MFHLSVSPCLDEAQLARWTTHSERAEAAAFGATRRRAEYLTWRALVRREAAAIGLTGAGEPPQVPLPAISYNAVGAPTIDLEGVWIGVAHCPDRVAVVIADHPCAVDIEPEGRDFSRAAARYLTDAERTLSPSPLLEGIAWCAKETLYKLAGRTALDLRRDLHLEALDLDRGTLLGRIRTEPPIPLRLLRRDGFIVVCTE